MTWFAFQLEAYEADTLHLTPAEDGIYCRLIRHYYKTRTPLPDNDRALAAIARIGVEEWLTVASTIRTFFKARAGRLHQKHCDEELDRQDRGALGRSAYAVKAAAIRWSSSPSKNHATRSERLSKARAKGTHTKLEWQTLLAICGPVCLRCSDPLSLPLVKDHITPIYKDGSDHIENVQPLCRRCNSSKGPNTKDYRPIDWFERLRDACATPAQSLQTPATLTLNPIPKEDTNPSGLVDPQLIVDCWNTMAKVNNLPEVQKLTDARKRLALARMKDAGGLEGIQAAVAKVAASPWLKGLRNGAGHENWRCTFDYLITERGFTKIMEGNYDERGNGAAPNRNGSAESKERQFARGLASVLGGDSADGRSGGPEGSG